MALSSLRSDLLNIPGIESAQLEGDAETPVGVRVRLGAGVDADLVGEEIRRVLASHGLRSELAAEQAAVRSVPRGERPAVEQPVIEELAADVPQEDVVTELVVARGHIAPVPDPPEPAVRPTPAVEVTTISSELPPTPAESVDAAAGDAASAPLSSVAVEEGRSGVSVVVEGSDGTRVQQRARSGAAGVDEAVVEAVAHLARPDAVSPLVVAITTGQIEGSDVVTVVLDVDGTRAVGSAVVEGGRPYAVGRAVWAALASS